jgi:hypothetical protein
VISMLDVMANEDAEARGRVTIRPWRVAPLVDTTSPEEVRGAVADLSSVWGGMLMPIFDKNAPVDELERLGAVFGVDSLYADVVDGPLGELLRRPGWAWRGGGQWGPFSASEDGFLSRVQELCLRRTGYGIHQVRTR